MDDWWMLLRRRGIAPSEINQMTIPEMKLEVMTALDPAYQPKNADEPDDGEGVAVFETEEEYGRALQALARGRRGSRG